MKKITFLLLAFNLICCLSLAQNQPVIRILKIEGEVFFSKTGTSEFNKCMEDTVLSKGDIIETGTEASITIAFDGEELNIVKISERTKVIVRIIDGERLELVDGEMFALLKGLNDEEVFEVKTPSVVCGARGTGWLMQIKENKTEIKVFDNEIYSVGINLDGSRMNKKVWTERGFKRTIVKGKNPEKKEKMSAKELTDLENQVKTAVDIKQMIKKKEVRDKIKNEKRNMAHENKLGKMDHLMNQSITLPTVPLPGRDDDNNNN